MLSYLQHRHTSLYKHCKSNYVVAVSRSTVSRAVQICSVIYSIILRRATATSYRAHGRRVHYRPSQYPVLLDGQERDRAYQCRLISLRLRRQRRISLVLRLRRLSLCCPPGPCDPLSLVYCCDLIDDVAFSNTKYAVSE